MVDIRIKAKVQTLEEIPEETSRLEFGDELSVNSLPKFASPYQGQQNTST